MLLHHLAVSHAVCLTMVFALACAPAPETTALTEATDESNATLSTPAWQTPDMYYAVPDVVSAAHHCWYPLSAKDRATLAGNPYVDAVGNPYHRTRRAITVLAVPDAELRAALAETQQTFEGAARALTLGVAALLGDIWVNQPPRPGCKPAPRSWLTPESEDWGPGSTSFALFWTVTFAAGAVGYNEEGIRTRQVAMCLQPLSASEPATVVPPETWRDVARALPLLDTNLRKAFARASLQEAGSLCEPLTQPPKNLPSLCENPSN